MPSDLALILIIPGFFILFIVLMFWHNGRSLSVLEQWAAKNDLTIIVEERRYVRRGPFFWSTSKGQEVFYVVVRDQNGHRKNGYVRCGSFWSGLFSDQVSVIWDDPDKP